MHKKTRNHEPEPGFQRVELDSSPTYEAIGFLYLPLAQADEMSGYLKVEKTMFYAREREAAEILRGHRHVLSGGDIPRPTRAEVDAEIERQKTGAGPAPDPFLTDLKAKMLGEISQADAADVAKTVGAFKHATAELVDALLADVPLPTNGRLLVPCINFQDMEAAKATAKTGAATADRDRNNGMLKMCEALLKRPSTRAIQAPDDPSAAMQMLSASAPHMRELADLIGLALAAAKATGRPPMIPPILLVGRPGVGKTHVTKALADALGVPMNMQSYGAQGSAGTSLAGADKHWGNAVSGLIWRVLSEGNVANPMIVLDELDKAGAVHVSSSKRSDPLNELLPLLEPVTAREHRDRYVEIRCDARHIVWIATANSLVDIQPPLLSRFRVVHVRPPGPRESLLLADAIARAVSAEMGLSVAEPRGEVRRVMAGMSPRLMRRTWTAAATRVLAAGRQSVTLDDIEHGLGIGRDVPHLH